MSLANVSNFRLVPGEGGAVAERRSVMPSLADISASPIVEAILNGTQPATLQLSDLEQPFPIDWEAQRTAFGFRAASAL
jgi:hypothetical protein